LYPTEIKTIGGRLKKRRFDLKLLQKEVATLIGVTEDCITNWENNRFKPQKRYLHAINLFLK
jgi:DNA-binding XRE family transcriptional regulator